MCTANHSEMYYILFQQHKQTARRHSREGSNFVMEVEEGFLEEVTFALSFGKRNGLLRDREDKERHFSQR